MTQSLLPCSFCGSDNLTYSTEVGVCVYCISCAPVGISAFDRTRAMNEMAKAHALFEYPKRECSSCKGTGREQDDTPCSNPNDAGLCGECAGRGYWQQSPTYADKWNAAMDVLEQFITPKRESGWQPIATAPQDGTLVDLWVNHPDFRGYRAIACHWCAKNDRWLDQNSYPVERDGIKATHWMPTPAAPEAV